MKNIFIYILLLILGLSIGTNGQTLDKKETLLIPDEKVGVIGYGSLLSKKSFETTLGKEYADSVRVVHVIGFERIWNFGLPNGSRNFLTYFLVEGDTIYPDHRISLNIQPAENKSINSCLYIVDTKDLELFDKREYGYRRINVKDKLEEIDIVNGDVYVYMALPDFTIKVEEDARKNVISFNYVKTIEDSFLQLGDSFKNEFRESTVPYPSAIVKDARRKLKKQ